MGDDGEDSYEARSNIGLMQSVSKTVNDAVHSAALAIVYIPKLEIQQYNTSDALKAFRSVSVLD
jgi:hypothetical protein